jgi:uncharacterized protein with HEPN domain
MDVDPAKYLWDAMAAAERIARFTAGKSRDHYASDDMLRSAVERQFEIIGEALGLFRRAAPDRAGAIPDVGRIVAFRNVLIHGYAEVDDDLVWEAVEKKLPELQATLGKLLEEYGEP